MSIGYTKKINISLTAEDLTLITELAEKDRRSTAQYTSILLEHTIAGLRVATNEIKAGEKTRA